MHTCRLTRRTGAATSTASRSNPWIPPGFRRCTAVLKINSQARSGHLWCVATQSEHMLRYEPASCPTCSCYKRAIKLPRHNYACALRQVAYGTVPAVEARELSTLVGEEPGAEAEVVLEDGRLAQLKLGKVAVPLRPALAAPVPLLVPCTHRPCIGMYT